MKKFFRLFLSLCFVLVLIGPAQAERIQNLTVSKLKVTSTADIQGLLQAAANTTGNVWYVDSGSGVDGVGEAGKSADLPFDTLDFAIGQCTADNGDIIVVMPGHAENLSTADGVDVDVAGVKIIGIGEGNNRPTFTYTATAGEFVLGAANVTIDNLRFVAGISNVTMAISVEAAADNCVIRNCEVPEPGTATYDFADIIDLASGADNLTVDNFTVRQVGVTAGDLDHFIEAGTGVNNRLTVINSVIEGEFTVAAIWSDTADTEVLIDNCIITNATDDQHAIEFTSTARGEIRNTLVRTNAQGTAVDPGSLTMSNVLWDDNDTADSVAIPVVAGGDATQAIEDADLDHLLGLDGATQIYPENAVDDSILAKLLSKSDPADISDYSNATDSLEALSDNLGTSTGTTTDSINGKIGTDTEMADSSLYDMWTAQPRTLLATKTDGAVLNGNDDIFVVSGGPVRAKIVGLVTTLVGGAADGRIKLTTTSPAATVDLNAGAVAIDNDAVGTIYHNLGATSVFTPSGGLGYVILDPVTVEETEFILTPGTVHFNGSAAQDGVIAWYCTYEPLVAGAKVTAAP